MAGNDRYEGFSVDFMDEISKHLQFNVTYQLVRDGKVSRESSKKYLPTTVTR